MTIVKRINNTIEIFYKEKEKKQVFAYMKENAYYITDIYKMPAEVFKDRKIRFTICGKKWRSI